MSVLNLEELSTPVLEALDRARTVVLLGLSPLETHGPHLPVGVDVMAARHLAQTVAQRLASDRPEWTILVGPTLPLGAFVFDAVGSIPIRQRVVRDVLLDYGGALARAGFRYILVLNGHGGPGHLVALEEAAAIVSRRHRILMASVTGHLAWEFLRGRYLAKVETVLRRPLTDDERRAFAEDAHGGWWETSLMLLLRPDLVDARFRALPSARYTFIQRLRPQYATRHEGPGYVGHPALADPAFAKAALEVLTSEVVDVAQALLDGRLRPAQCRSPFFAIPLFRTNFWPVTGAVALILATWWLARSTYPRSRGAETH